MKTKIKYNCYAFRVKVGSKYIIPGGRRGNYEGRYYKEKDIPKVVEEIEGEYPKYKGKVKPFRLILEEV